MRLIVVGILIIITCITSCKSKKNEAQNDKKFISVLSLIESQVAHVDTSLYAIIKVEYIDTGHKDTTYIPREKFREVAHDFLSIPDLSDPKVAKRYMEEPARYDELLGRVILSYVPIDPKNEEIKKQELLITPSQATGDKVSNIIINREISNRDGYLKQDMLWMMDRSFQVTTTTQKVGQPEVTTVTRVIWNEENE